MSSIFLYNRPLDYYAKLPAAYLAVTPEDVTRVAKETIHPNQYLILAVGDKAKIKPALKELNLAPLEYSDPLGNILK
jgi:zinc protease